MIGVFISTSPVQALGVVTKASRGGERCTAHSVAALHWNSATQSVHRSPSRCGPRWVRRWTEEARRKAQDLCSCSTNTGLISLGRPDLGPSATRGGDRPRPSPPAHQFQRCRSRVQTSACLPRHVRSGSLALAATIGSGGSNRAIPSHSGRSDISVVPRPPALAS